MGQEITPIVVWISSDTGRWRKEHRQREQEAKDRAKAESRPLVLVKEKEKYAKVTVRLDPMGRRFYADAIDDLQSRYDTVKDCAQADSEQKTHPTFLDREHGTWEWASVTKLLPEYAQQMAEEFGAVASDPANSTTQGRRNF